jgi:hypothetical protein
MSQSCLEGTLKPYSVCAAGELVHTHTGANKSKLEYFMRQKLSARERPVNELYPVQVTASGYR